MSNIFAIKRFYRYFIFDLRNVKDSFLIRMIFLALLPVITFVIVELFSLVFSGYLVEMPADTRNSLISAGFIIVMLSAPFRIYGKITGKKYGSAWLLVPASTFEKFLSMILMLCLIIPACMLLLVIVVDSIASLIPYYGLSILKMDSAPMVFFRVTDYSQALVDFITIWFVNELSYTLGALVFRKAKFIKTMFVQAGLAGIVFMTLILVIRVGAQNSGTSWYSFISMADTDLKVLLNVITYIIFALVCIALGLGVFARIKTLKH